MPWQQEKEEWLEHPVDEERPMISFYERGKQLLGLWAKYCLTEMELKLRIGYAVDAKTDKRLQAIIGVVINQEPLIDFSCEELGRLVEFMRKTQSHVTAGLPESFLEEYQESLDGFLDALELGIVQAQQFEPTNIN